MIKKLGKKTLFQICSSKSKLSSLLCNLNVIPPCTCLWTSTSQPQKVKVMLGKKDTGMSCLWTTPQQIRWAKLKCQKAIPFQRNEFMFSNHHFRGAVSKAHWPMFHSSIPTPPKKGQVSCFFNGQKMVHSMGTCNICHQMGLSHEDTPNRLRRNHSFIEVHRLAVSIFSEVFWISEGITKTMQGMNAFWGACISLKWSEFRKSRNTHMSSTSTSNMWWWKSKSKSGLWH